MAGTRRWLFVHSLALVGAIGTMLLFDSPWADAAEPIYKAPIYKASPVVAPLWDGFYAGGNIGYGPGSADTTASTTFLPPVGGPITAAFGPQKVPLRGPNAGAQAGYNWRLAPHWLFGAEADFQWSGEKGSATNTFSASPVVDDEFCIGCTTGQTTVKARMNWFGTVRARTGYIWNNWLFYATGGLAYGRVTLSSNVDANLTAFPDCGGGCSFSGTFSQSKWRMGWTAGGGVESKIGNSNWSWKIEYLYLDLGSASGDVPLTGAFSFCAAMPCGAPITGALNNTEHVSSRVTDNIIRVGLNYRFGSGPLF